VGAADGSASKIERKQFYNFGEQSLTELLNQFQTRSMKRS